MSQLQNIDPRTVQSFIRDGFLPADVLVDYGREQGLHMELIPDPTANRMWLYNGGTFIAVAICLVNDGNYDHIVDDYALEIPWAPQVELLEESEQSFSQIF